MEEIKVHTSDNLMFTFEGDREVNALSVARAIEGLVDLSGAIAENNYPDVEFRLSVCAVSPGSLNLVFIAAAAAAQTLLTPEGIQYAKSLPEIIKISFEVKKFLKGKEPAKKIESGEKIEITNADGSKISIPTGAGVFFTDQRIDRSITNIFNNALISPGVSGVRLTSDDGSAVQIPMSDFATCATPIEVEQDQDLNETVQYDRKNEILYIRKPDVLGKTQWGFLSDRYFLADIEDKDFLESVLTGRQHIVAKMYIVADMKVTVKIGADGLPDEKTCHRVVTKVHSIHSPDENETMRIGGV